MKHLVTGATGNVGSRVVDGLIARGERPRVFVRDEAKARARFGDRVEVRVGDLDDARSLARAFDGVDALFLLNDGPELADRDALAIGVAKSTRVAHVVKLSSMDVRSDRASQSVGGWHARGEAAIRESGVPWTFVQPVGFMSNALAWAPSIRAQSVVRAPTGDGTIAMIHPDDIAAVCIEALVTRRFAGESIAITGPTLLSYAQMAAAIGEAIGKTVTYEPIDDDAAHARLLANGMEPVLAGKLVSLWRSVREGRHAIVTDGVLRVTGQPPRTFASWASENAAAFQLPT